MQLETLQTIVVNALEEVKAQDIKVLDVRRIASFTDLMIIASGSSTRQVKALADKVVEKCTTDIFMQIVKLSAFNGANLGCYAWKLS